MDSEQLDASSGVWEAVWALADAWSETPVVRDFAGVLPRNRPPADRSADAKGVPALLHHFDISIGTMMHPLRYGSRLPVLLRDPMFAGFGLPEVEASELASFLRGARRIEEAHSVSLAWLRSSLAGYPMLRAPQLAPGTPLTTNEMSTGFIWHKQELAAGLNLRSSPPRVADLLGADATTGAALGAAARKLSAELSESLEWTEFRRSSLALDEQAKTQLREARRELKLRLADDRLDQHEEILALARMEYRAHRTADAIDALTGLARAYAPAINRVDRLLTLASCDVFGDLALYGEPWPISVLSLDVPVAGQPMVEFECAGATGLFLDVGQVIWLDRSVVKDAVRIQRKTFTFDLAEPPRERLFARVLRGTADAWPA